MKTLQSLFSVNLISPITLTFNSKYPQQPLVISQLNAVVTDNGSAVTVKFNGGSIPFSVVLWNATSTPPYSSTPVGTGAGDTWTTSTAQSRVEELMGNTLDTQVAFVKSLFPPTLIS